MRAFRVLSHLQNPWRFKSMSTLGSTVPLSRSEALVKEMSPIANFLVIVTTIGAVGAFFTSRLAKLEERVTGLLKEVDAKVVGIVKEVDAKVAGVVKEVDAKVAGAKETADETVRELRTACPPTHALILTLRTPTPCSAVRPSQVKMFLGTPVRVFCRCKGLHTDVLKFCSTAFSMNCISAPPIS
jgi:hypothetical protein